MVLLLFFFFNDTATTEIYTLSLHDALPIWRAPRRPPAPPRRSRASGPTAPGRSEEHTSELQSQSNLVCRLLLEKKKKHKDRVAQRLRHNEPPKHPTTDGSYEPSYSNVHDDY